MVFIAIILETYDSNLQRNNAEKTSLISGFVLLAVAFLIFLFYGNVAVGIALLAVGVIFVVNGGRHMTHKNSAPEIKQL
jgi:uncharacterized membrane protein YfcA